MTGQELTGLTDAWYKSTAYNIVFERDIENTTNQINKMIVAVEERMKTSTNDSWAKIKNELYFLLFKIKEIK